MGWGVINKLGRSRIKLVAWFCSIGFDALWMTDILESGWDLDRTVNRGKPLIWGNYWNAGKTQAR